jgi:hypothetical protein
VQVSIKQPRGSAGSFQPLATLTAKCYRQALATVFDPTRWSAPR